MKQTEAVPEPPDFILETLQRLADETTWENLPEHALRMLCMLWIIGDTNPGEMANILASGHYVSQSELLRNQLYVRATAQKILDVIEEGDY